MRQVFANVPTIYGFSSMAPLGPTAAALLTRHFLSSGAGEVGSGRPSSRRVGRFAACPMVVAAGLTDADPQAAYRQDNCQFADDRLSTAQKLEFIHRLLDREMAEVRMFIERIEELAASISESERRTPEVARALDAIAGDRAARTRYLEFARDTDLPATRARMLKLANTLGWLSAAELRAEMIEMFGQRLARSTVGAADVDLACSLNESHELDQDVGRLQVSPSQAVKAGHAAALACLGSAESHARVLAALTSGDDADVEIAQVYLYHRPITEVNELRAIGKGITRMADPAAQVHAIDTLARHRLSDRETLDELVRLFTVTKSPAVQTAIANALIRADYRALATLDLVGTLRLHRLKSPPGEDPIDVLIRRLEASVGPAAGHVESLSNNRRNA
jgi:hypothetical protein